MEEAFDGVQEAISVVDMELLICSQPRSTRHGPRNHVGPFATHLEHGHAISTFNKHQTGFTTFRRSEGEASWFNRHSRGKREEERGKMGTDEVPMDDKAKRMRDLLSSFYSPDPSNSDATSKHASLDDINSTSFDPDQYMNILVKSYPSSSTNHSHRGPRT